jgi:CRISPR-associated protein (TIGR02584 family)
MRACVIVADLGPNPAPLAELIWALCRQRGWCAKAAYLTSYAHAVRYLESEFLAHGAALDQLRAVLGGEALLGQGDVRVERAYAGGEALEDERTEAQALAWAEARWRSAQRAQEAAGEAPVVFALIGGRRRSMAAQQAVLFQLLARPQDVCLDVRVSDPRVEGGTGFFFPEQPQRWVACKGGGEVEAAQVQVELIELPVPRLRALIPAGALASHAAALVASSRALAAATPPQVVLDYASQEVRVSGAALALSTPQLIWYAALLTRRASGVAQGWVRVDDLAVIADAIDALEGEATGRFSYARSAVLTRLFSDPAHVNHWRRRAPMDKLNADDAPALAKLRADTRARIEKALQQAEHTHWTRLIVPEVRHGWTASGDLSVKSSYQRVALDPIHIQIIP